MSAAAAVELIARGAHSAAPARTMPAPPPPRTGAPATPPRSRREPPTELYARGLRDGRMHLRSEDGRRRPLPIGRWLGPLDRADELALDRACGPVLDVGCGPGRHVLALTRRGVAALGVDIAAAAVGHARNQGAAVVLGSVFDPVPDAGLWRTALLLDGNIGIGGRPAALLARLRSVLRADGSVICEVGGPNAATTCELVALEDADGVRSDWFAWARVGIDGVGTLSARAGFRFEEAWQDEGRWFVLLSASSDRDAGVSEHDAELVAGR